KAIGEARLLHSEILPYQIDLVLECNLVGPRPTKRAPQHIAQLLDHARRGRGVAVAHEHGNGVETVEEKVRVELRRERGETRARQLLRQTRHLHLTLPYLLEVANGVLDPDDGQVHGDAERERDEEPAHEIHDGMAVQTL